MKFYLIFFVTCAILWSLNEAVEKKGKHKKKDGGNKFAILAATTKGWLYYRHQATLLHAYHTLIANGFKKENIITMFYDDLVNHPRNPDKGKVKNHPNGPDLYAGVKKDYTKEKVNADTFYAVLTGDANTAKGPVLKSGPKDSVFIYIVGFGAPQYLTFPTGPGLSAQKFVGALKKLRSDNKARKIYVNLEVSFAATLVSGLLPRKDNIFVSAATHYTELPGACYCMVKQKICYGSVYGCAWTHFSDRLRQLKYGARRSLFDQFNFVRTNTPYSHVNFFGHLETGSNRLKDYLDYKLVPKKNADNSERTSPLISQLAEAAIDELNEMNDDDVAAVDTHKKQHDSLYEYLGINDEIVPNMDFMNTNGNVGVMMNALDIAPAFMKGDSSADEEDEEVEENLDNISDDEDDEIANGPNGDAIKSVLRPKMGIFENNDVEKGEKYKKMLGIEKSSHSTIIKDRKNIDAIFDEIHQQLQTEIPNVNLAKVDSIIEPLDDKAAEIYDNAIRTFNLECLDTNENTYAQTQLGKLAVLAQIGIDLEKQVAAMKSVCAGKEKIMNGLL